MKKKKINLPIMKRMSDVSRAMRAYGFEIDIVSDEEFEKRIGGNVGR